MKVRIPLGGCTAAAVLSVGLGSLVVVIRVYQAFSDR
jgi:hypothetical protein